MQPMKLWKPTVLNLCVQSNGALSHSEYRVVSLKVLKLLSVAAPCRASAPPGLMDARHIPMALDSHSFCSGLVWFRNQIYLIYLNVSLFL